MAAATASGGSLEATLDKKFRGVTNTMDSIQGLSAWCIDNKKYHSLIVRHWMKCLKKSDSSHRLNLLYLANDVIQNCKRKNAIVYRTAFAEILPDAFLLVSREGDSKVNKSVERILTIWEERDVYSGTLVSELRGILTKEESPPVEQETPVESKADLRSKVLAEFVPQALLDQLSKYKRSLEEVELREKQLAAMRVDIFSTDALKKLKDKVGGKKFSKDFEEGSTQLHEFVKFYEKQLKTGPELIDTLTNADIFYEMQYKEVKIVANAYQTFANRVSHLKRKLDALKDSLPDLDDSPIPSPSADAPSPTGSESPFHGLELAHPDPDLDGSAMDDDAEPPAPSPLSSPGASPKSNEVMGENDNREVEDMELSEEETDAGGIIFEEQVESVPTKKSPTPVPVKSQPAAAIEPSAVKVTPPAATPVAAVKTEKTPGPKEDKLPTPAPVNASKATPTVPGALQDASSLVSLLSKVDMSPADLLSALSKVQSQSSLQGISSLVSNSPAGTPHSSGAGETSTLLAPTTTAPHQGLSTPVISSLSTSTQVKMSSQVPQQTSNKASALVQALHRDMDLTTEAEPSPSSSSLDSKIHNFLKGNPAFSAFDLNFPNTPSLGGNNFSPATGADNQGGTPVRDEGGGTPTQDEFMDKPAAPPNSSSVNQLSVGETAKTAPLPFANNQQTPTNPQFSAHLQPDSAQNGQIYQPYQDVLKEPQVATPPAPYQVPVQAVGTLIGETAAGNVTNQQNMVGFQGGSERNWYSDGFTDGGGRRPVGYNAAGTEGAAENRPPGLYPYQSQQTQEHQSFVPQQQQPVAPTPFFTGNLPPVPKLPPPPPIFGAIPPTVPPVVQQQEHREDPGALVEPKRDGNAGGMVVLDHQHKSLLVPDDQPYEMDSGSLLYQEEAEPYPNNGQRDTHFPPGDPFRPPNESFYGPRSPQSFPRGRGRPTLPQPAEPYYPYEFQQRSPPPQFAPRRPPLLHEPRRPGPRLPHRLPRLPHPRGAPLNPFPRFQGPDPSLRFKRPGPRMGVPRGVGPMFAPKRPFLPPRF